jgi:3'-phosphoadenosine 5'-phosphosulfate sulfotransferase (PAPS reductase)/FAD synthetase
MGFAVSRIVVWFSCGVTSAVAAKLVLQKHPNAILAYCDTGSEHPDNVRFLKECEKWFSKKIKILRSQKYQDIWDVFNKTRYLAGVNGARCTTEMKKLVRRDFERFEDTQVFGFDSSEHARADRFREHNPEVTAWFPLIDKGYSKQDCLRIVQKAGIRLPAMYQLGYNNNNCIGCVKGGQGYWNKIRKDFPAVFWRMAAMERKLDVALLKVTGDHGERKRVFLDELDPDAGRHTDLEIVCGLFCGEI